MEHKLIFAVTALLVLGLTSCMPPCPPGTELSPDGICVEAGAEGGETPELISPIEEGVQLEDSLKENLIEKTDGQEEAENATQDAKISGDKGGVNESGPETPVSENTAEFTGEAEETKDLTISESAREKLRQFKRLYETKVKSYEFTEPEIGQYKIRGDTVKVVLLSARNKRNVKYENRTIPVFYYDTIYYDTKTGEILVFCEGLKTDLKKSCRKSDIENVPVRLRAIEVGDIFLDIPHEWLFSLYEESVPTSIGEGKYYVHDRAVSRIDFAEPPGIVYFDPLNGLPLRLEITQNGKLKRISFKDLTIDTVKETEMRNRPFKDIPFQEHLN